MNHILEQRAVVSEEGKLTITIESEQLHKGETVIVAVTPVAVKAGQLTSLIGAAKRTKRGKTSFQSEQDIDDFINDFRGNE